MDTKESEGKNKNPLLVLLLVDSVQTQLQERSY